MAATTAATAATATATGTATTAATAAATSATFVFDRRAGRSRYVARAGGVMLVGALAALSCKPNVGLPSYLVTDYALLAVKGEPPEAKPGSSVTYSFLLASPNGTVPDATALWDICETPKPPSETNSVASACTGPPDASAASAGQTLTAPVPSNACRLFGPVPPTPVPGQPAVSPRNPDSTGGYYLPVQLYLTSATAAATEPAAPMGPLMGFAMERIACGLANAATDIIAEYTTDYTFNTNPVIDHVDVVDSAGNEADLASGPSLVAGSQVTITVALAGPAPVFPVYDQVSGLLVQQTQSYSFFWFASGGSFAAAQTDVGGNADAALLADSNTWTVPPAAQTTAYLWVVVRDSRGGTAFGSYQVTVVP
ncbi:MAG: hypothetical protein ABSB49_10520 [Polyangia bacterium]